MALQQITNQPFLYINDMQISNNATTPDTKIDVTAGQCRDSGNSYDIVCQAATINPAITGANGIDTGSLITANWYAIHAIGDSTNANKGAYLLSLSRTAPVLPRGYDVFRFIGWGLTDSSAHFYKYKVYGNGNLRKYYWDAVFTELTDGAATSFTDVNLQSSASPTSTLVILNWKIVPATAGNIASLRVNGSSALATVQLTGSVAAKANVGFLTMNTDTSQIIEYVVANASDALTLYSVGFEDFI